MVLPGREHEEVAKTALPPGHSSPVLTRTHIFLTGVDGKTLLVLALDRATGRELWRREVPRTRSGRLENVNGPHNIGRVRLDGIVVAAAYNGLRGHVQDHIRPALRHGGL